ncbi:hypothetical protein A2U01_0047691, partial [Trifolium medium]|nr:hypothetical protein [Trifolium medium]
YLFEDIGDGSTFQTAFTSSIWAANPILF